MGSIASPVLSLTITKSTKEQHHTTYQYDIFSQTRTGPNLCVVGANLLGPNLHLCQLKAFYICGQKED